MNAFLATVRRDLLLALRRKSEVLTAVFFFVIVTSLFPLGIGPEPVLLKKIAPGILWVAALLATLLGLPRLFAADHVDGTLEQMALSPSPLGLLVAGKILAHWLLCGLPLVLLAPVLGLQFDLDASTLGILTLALFLGTPLLSLIGAIGAALTLGVRGGGVLLALLVLPLYIPALIFGAGAVEAHIAGLDAGGHLSLLAAMLAVAAFFCAVGDHGGLEDCVGVRQSIIQWFRFASPQSFYPLAGRMIPWFWAAAAAFGIAGLWISFFVAPTDAQQGEGYRIIFVHVPASWMSMFIYLVMAFWAGLGLALNTRLSGMMAQSLAPTGALMAALSLWTGALWGKPMWGAWWVWDARLTSELILFFLYLGFMALQAAIDDPRRADKAGAILALVGVVNIPIIYFSVKWWNTLHQGSTINLTKAPSMAQTMLWGMLLMALCFWMYSIAVALTRVRAIILERERHTEWVKHALE